MAQRIILEGAALCRPFTQGELDNLCGLYAAINAIRAVSSPTHPIGQSTAKQLLERGVSYLTHRKRLSEALIGGMGLRLQRDLAVHLTKEAAALTGTTYATRALHGKGARAGRDALFQAIEGSLRLGAAVVVCLENTFQHYTVIVGQSPTRFYLFDSDGLRWVERRSLGLCGGEGATLRHCIRANTAFAIAARPCQVSLNFMIPTRKIE